MIAVFKFDIDILPNTKESKRDSLNKLACDTHATSVRHKRQSAH